MEYSSLDERRASSRWLHQTSLNDLLCATESTENNLHYCVFIAAQLISASFRTPLFEVMQAKSGARTSRCVIAAPLFHELETMSGFDGRFVPYLFLRLGYRFHLLRMQDINFRMGLSRKEASTFVLRTSAVLRWCVVREPTPAEGGEDPRKT